VCTPIDVLAYAVRAGAARVLMQGTAGQLPFFFFFFLRRSVLFGFRTSRLSTRSRFFGFFRIDSATTTLAVSARAFSSAHVLRLLQPSGAGGLNRLQPAFHSESRKPPTLGGIPERWIAKPRRLCASRFGHSQRACAWSSTTTFSSSVAKALL